MRAIEKLFVAIMCVSLIRCAGAPQEMAELTNGKQFFIQTNIWYESPEKIYSTNYHVGGIIPLGTKVNIVRLESDTIRFQPLDSGVVFTMIHVPKYSNISFRELFDRQFSEKNPLAEDGRFYQFSNKEQINIKNAKIVPGMCREAVLMAYGYPPTHATPTLSTRTWTYWKNRFRRQHVTFDGDKVINITP